MRRRTSHSISDAADDIARYSAPAEELETVCCFFDFQLMGELPNNKRYPGTDRQESRHEAQPEVEKA